MGDCHTPLPREVRNGNDTTPLFTFKEDRMMGRHAFARRQFICWRDVPHSRRPSSSRYVGSAAHPLRRAAVYYRLLPASLALRSDVFELPIISPARRAKASSSTGVGCGISHLHRIGLAAATLDRSWRFVLRDQVPRKIEQPLRKHACTVGELLRVSHHRDVVLHVLVRPAARMSNKREL